MPDFEAANKLRDRRLRRQMLQTLQHARGYVRGGLNGQTLVDVINADAADGQGFSDGDHALALITDLANKDLIAKPEVEGLRRGQRLQPSHLFVRIADKGSDLLNEEIPPVPGVDDDRVEVR